MLTHDLPADVTAQTRFDALAHAVESYVSPKAQPLICPKHRTVSEKTISVAVVFGILLVTFAAVDNFSRLFFASAALTVGLIAIITIPQDRPRGYVQRTALGVLGFLLFGYCFGYIGYFANSPEYRPILMLLILGVELNDVFAFCCGKLIGGPKAVPNTSPGNLPVGRRRSRARRSARAHAE